MAYAAQSNIEDLDIGLYLKIYAAKGIYNALPDQSEAWKMMYKRRKKAAEGREHRYNVRSALGMASAQFVPVDDGAYPTAQRTTLNEGKALFKDFAVALDVPRTLLDKGMSDLAVYGQPLAEELDAQGIAVARVLSASVYGDGSGAIGLVSTATADTTADTVTITLDTADATNARSHIGFIEIGDKVKFASAAGVVQDKVDTSTQVDYWQIVSKDDDTDSFVVKPYTNAGAAVDIAAALTGGPAVSTYVYRIGIKPNDLTAISTNDYNTLSEMWPGLESLGADDGRRVNGLTLSGNLAGTRFDCEGSNIDSSHFQQAMSKVKRRVGGSRYQYKTALMYDTQYDAIVEAGETDRRFAERDDLQRGVKTLGFQHKKDFIEFVTDEFCPKKRIIILPDSKEVLHFIGSEMKHVAPNGNDKFHLGVNSNGQHTRSIKAYMEGNGVMVCLHSAAICTLHNMAS